jgi:hypothetical protein
MKNFRLVTYCAISACSPRSATSLSVASRDGSLLGPISFNTVFTSNWLNTNFKIYADETCISSQSYKLKVGRIIYSYSQNLSHNVNQQIRSRTPRLMSFA